MTLVWMESKIKDEIKRNIEAFAGASFKSVGISELNQEILSKETIFLFFPSEINPKEVAPEEFDFPNLKNNFERHEFKNFGRFFPSFPGIRFCLLQSFHLYFKSARAGNVQIQKRPTDSSE